MQHTHVLSLWRWVNQELEHRGCIGSLAQLMGILTNSFNFGSLSLFLISLLFHQRFWLRLSCPASLVPEFYVMASLCFGPPGYWFSFLTQHLPLFPLLIQILLMLKHVSLDNFYRNYIVLYHSTCVISCLVHMTSVYSLFIYCSGSVLVV